MGQGEAASSRNPRKRPTKPSLPWSGVFALEGEWGELTDRTSVLPVLETLERQRIIDFVRRDVGTRAELDHYLTAWRTTLPHYCMLYLGFHGTETSDGLHALWISDDNDGTATVQSLGGDLAGKLNNCVVYFGSCSVMGAPSPVLKGFLRTTGARAVMGYKHTVGWVDSAALDLIVLSWLATYQQLAAAIKSIERPEYKSLTTKLGFKIVRA